MKCPYCETDNREDREVCYHCGKDLSMLRLIANKARHHYNVALEHAERQRYPQALAELEHCLELDRSFVPAHVVMGTIYSRMEKFDEAERCWKAALALDPHIQKAHEYIDKSQLAKQAIPLLRRLRGLIGLAAAVAAVLLGLILWQLRPAFDRRHMDRLFAEIEKGDYAAAFEAAQRLEDNARSAEIRHAARLLEYTIGQRYESAAMDMVTLLLNDKPLEAYELYRHLTEGHQPPAPFNRQLASLCQKARDQAVGLVEGWRRQFDEGTLPYDELERRIARFSKAFASQTDTLARINGHLTWARRAWADRALRGLPAEALSTSETLVWLARVREVVRRAPDSRAAASSATLRLIAAAVVPLEQRAKKALAAKDEAALRAVLNDLDRLAAYGQPEALVQLNGKIRADVRRLEREQFAARLAAAGAADIPKLDGWVASLEKATSVTAANDAEVSAVLTRAKRRLAGEVMAWCADREGRFQSGRIKPDEARWIADRAEFALTYYGGRSWRGTRDCVTFGAAAAWLQLGNAPQALQWIERLEKTYPESAYLSSARRLKAKAAPPGPAAPAKEKSAAATPAPAVPEKEPAAKSAPTPTPAKAKEKKTKTPSSPQKAKPTKASSTPAAK